MTAAAVGVQREQLRTNIRGARPLCGRLGCGSVFECCFSKLPATQPNFFESFG